MKKQAICGFLVEKHLQFNDYFLMHIPEQILTILCCGLQKKSQTLLCVIPMSPRREDKDEDKDGE